LTRARKKGKAVNLLGRIAAVGAELHALARTAAVGAELGTAAGRGGTSGCWRSIGLDLLLSKRTLIKSGLS